MGHAFPLILTATASVLGAQTVWYPPNDADLAPWIAQAAPGDILQLASQHPNFTLNKGLTLVAPSSGSSFIHGVALGPLITASNIVVNVPAGQRALLSGVSLSAASTGYTLLPAQISTVGDVSLEGVQVGGGAVVLGAGVVLLQNCNLTGPVTYSALRIQGATCCIANSVVTGGNGSIYGGGGPAVAITVASGSLLASHVDATGGSGLVFPFGKAALDVSAGIAFVTDCILTGGAGTAAVAGLEGGHAIESTGTVSVARTTLTDGAFAIGPSTGYQIVPQMVGLGLSAFPTRGQSFTVTASTGGGQLLGIVGGFDYAMGTVPPIVEPLFGQPQNLVALALAIQPIGAQVAATVAVPNVAALFGVGVWLQAIQVAGGEIRASAVVGGTIR